MFLSRDHVAYRRFWYTVHLVCGITYVIHICHISTQCAQCVLNTVVGTRNTVIGRVIHG